jgi:hypothetical protein
MVAPSGIKPERTGLKGLLDRLLAANLERLLAIPGSKRYKQLEAASKDVEATQNAVLKEIVDFAKDTVFGKAHGFSDIRTHADYKERVPVMDYEAHRPYIERHQKGEADVLFPGRPLMYNCSSGTTSKPKLIPVTPYNFEHSIKGRSKLWLYGIMRHFPGIYDGKALGVVSPATEGTVEDGTPYGSISGLIRSNLPPFIAQTNTAPYSAMLISDFPSKTYTICRFGLACDVTIIITGNPATVINVARRADERKEDIIRDIRDGTLKADLDIDPEIRKELEGRLEPAPARAAELQRLAESGDRLRPADYWPNLKLIHTWTHGNTGLMVPKLKQWFREETPVLDFGYVSSEILSTDLILPENGGSVLAVQTGFYELSPFEDEDKPDKRFLMAHQLELGKRYYVYITTFSGLYRYDMNDVVEVLGFFNKAPVIKFLFKGKGITNMQGEKLSEAQFIEAVGMAAEKTGMKHDFYLGFADVDESRYKLYIELLESTSFEEQKQFAKAVDEALREVNMEYDAKYKSDRIRPLEVIDMGRDFFTRYRTLRLQEGAYEGQIKWLQLSSMPATKRRLEQLLKDRDK